MTLMRKSIYTSSKRSARARISQSIRQLLDVYSQYDSEDEAAGPWLSW